MYGQYTSVLPISKIRTFKDAFKCRREKLRDGGVSERILKVSPWPVCRVDKCGASKFRENRGTRTGECSHLRNIRMDEN